MKKTKLLLNIILAATALTFITCKKDKKTEEETTTTTTTADKKYALVIENGAQSIDQGKVITYNAYLVSSTGATVSASGVSWSSSIGGMVGANFTYATDTTALITASVDFEGVKYTASVPVAVNPLSNTQLFAVVPSAIIWSTNSGPIQLNTIYMGNQTASYTYASDNSGIATVSSSGNITFVGNGNTRIKVTANIGGQVSTVYVPVLVVGPPEAPLPVTRVVLTPALYEMFRNETVQLNAKAYNSKGEDVSGTVTFNYLAIQKTEDDEETEMPITVSSSGLVTAKALGGAYVKVTAAGVMGQCEIEVNPDTVILVTPFMVTLGTDLMNPLNPPKTSENLTATTYKVDRTIYKNKSGNYLSVIANPSNLVWDLPLTGIPEIDNLFNVATLTNKSLTGVTVNSIQGKFGSTFVIAHAGDNAGGASVIVNP